MGWASMTGGHGHLPDQGASPYAQANYGQAPAPGDAGPSPYGPGGGQSAPPGGPQLSGSTARSGRVPWWVFLGIVVLGALVTGVVLVGLRLFATDSDPEPPPAPAAADPDPTQTESAEGRDGDDGTVTDGGGVDGDDEDAGAETGGTDDGTDDGKDARTESDGAVGPEGSGGSGERPQVAPAGSLPSADAAMLGDVIDIRVSQLRYNEGELFGSYFYRCLFTIELENLTDLDQEFEMGFAVPLVPEVQWAGHTHSLEPRENSEIVAGWETTDASELGITPQECHGNEVELIQLEVEPG